MIFDGWLGLQMRAFYKSYPNEAIVQQPAAQIPWFHKSKALPDELRGNLPTIEEQEAELEGMGGTGGNLRMACEELFDVLPENWTWMTLGQACADGGGDIQTGPFGSQLHASDYVPEGIPSIMPQNIGDNRIILYGIAHIKPEDAKRLKRYLVQNGDIV